MFWDCLRCCYFVVTFLGCCFKMLLFEVLLYDTAVIDSRFSSLSSTRG